MDDQSEVNSRNPQYYQAPSTVPDIRIEIHAPEIHPTLQHYSLSSEAAVQPNLTSILSQARDEIERRAVRTRLWGNSFYNVIQGVRPLVRQAHNMNNLHSWLPNTNQRDTLPINDPPLMIGNEQLLSIGVSNETQSAADTNANDNITSVNERISLPSSRPLQDRVAVLTRDDPPNLIERSSSQRIGNARDNQSNNEGNIADDVFADMPESRRYFDMFMQYIPYICILLAKSAYDNLNVLADIVTLYLLFIHGNSVVKDQVLKNTQRKIITLLRQLFFIFSITFIRFFVIGNWETYMKLLTINFDTDSITLSQLLLAVIIIDIKLKLVTIIFKILITMLPPSVIEYKGRGRIYVLIESLSQLYRSCVPIQPWLIFLLDSYTGAEKILGVLFSTAYIVSKGVNLVEKGRFCKRSFASLLRKISYGNAPTKEQIQATGGQCPICHDNYDNPVILECSHIFCDACVGSWFLKKPTCPLCRSKVIENPRWQDGATTFFVQLY